MKNKLNTKFDRVARIPTIESIRKPAATVLPKTQLCRPIHSRTRKHDYQTKFDTQEQIQSEKQCDHISMNSYQDSTHLKNSFSSMMKNWKKSRGRENSLCNENIVVSNNNNKLGFFHCDSICIRSNVVPPPSKEIEHCRKEENQVKTGVEETDHEQSFKNNCKARRKGGIFQLKKNNHEDVPWALREPLLANNYLQQRGPNQFHIVFETDQITQCCL